MTKDDRFASESADEGGEIHWDPDLLIALVGQYIAQKYPGILEDDARVMNYLARQSRLRPPRATDWSRDRVRRVRERVLERALAEKLSVRSERGPSRVREVAPLAMERAVEVASRTASAAWPALAVAAGDGRELWDEECDRLIELPEGTPLGRYVALSVSGDSMLPLLHAGDTLLVRLGTELKRDTVVVARRADDGYVVKRVGAIQRRRVELLSLNAEYPPVSIPNDSRAVLGTVVMRWCAHDVHPIIPRRAD
jgi:SOS-response transcriptional repressor LexA